MRVVILMVLAALLSGCGYNQIQQKDEAVKASWSQVLNVYKRRADLVPNLVATVKGYASHEERVFTEVTQARSKVGSVNVNADDPASLAQFQQAQGQLQSAIGTRRLRVNFMRSYGVAGFEARTGASPVSVWPAGRCAAFQSIAIRIRARPLG